MYFLAPALVLLLPSPAQARTPLARPAAKPAPAQAPQPAPAQARAHVHDGMVTTCKRPGGDAPDGVGPCPATFTAVETAPLATGPVVLTTWAARAAPPEAGSGPCDWITVPVRLGPEQTAPTGRTVTTLPLDHARYRKLVGEAIGEESVQLTALARVDLQGDGSDEVLFAAESHPTPAGEPWPFPTTGHVYSAVGVRYLVDGDVKTHLFFQHAHDLGDDPDDFEAMAYQRGTLLGLTDVEGDGVLEIVVGSAYYEGAGADVWSLTGPTPTHRGGAACGA